MELVSVLFVNHALKVIFYLFLHQILKMKNLQIVALIVITAFLSSCSSEPQYAGLTIDGALTNAEVGAKVYLDNLKGNQINVLDTATVDAEGKFQLRTEMKENSIGRIRYGRANVMLLLENGSDYTITADARNPNDYNIDGHQDSKTWNELVKGLRTRQVGPEQIVAFVDTVKNPLLGYLAINQIKPEDHKAAFEKFATRMESEIPNSSFTKDIKNKLKATASLANVAVGGVAPDIVLQNPDGREMKLSDLRGQVVLLDFWASWCKPCRRENPNVVVAYNKYNKKGFTVANISLDSNREKWKQAIEIDNLKWDFHVSDLKGWKSSAAATYGVRSIPQTFLLDKEGKIIAKNLRGAALEKKLEEVLGA